MSDRSGQRNSVTVEIAGERHVLKSDAPPEYTQSVAAHVDGMLKSIRMGNALDPQKAAILAALTITDELFRAREEVKNLREEMKRRSGRLAEMLEKASGEESASK